MHHLLVSPAKISRTRARSSGVSTATRALALAWHHPHAHAVVQGAKLLEALRQLEGGGGEGGEAQQGRAAVDVEADVLAGEPAGHREGRGRGAGRPPPVARRGWGCARSRGRLPRRPSPPSPRTGSASRKRSSRARTRWPREGWDRRGAPRTAASMPSGSSSGSSPCTFTTISASSSPRTTSASRSVPLACSAEVITAWPPKARHGVGDALGRPWPRARDPPDARAPPARAPAGSSAFRGSPREASPATVWN